MILLVDHDDSFVNTLADYVEAAGHPAQVTRERDVDLARLRAAPPAGIILSPGPGAPEACRTSLAIVRELGAAIPVLGVCLGHQVIATACGATVARAGQPRHGMTSPVRHDGSGVYRGLPSPFDATRYHSLSVVAATVPAALRVVSAALDDGEIMGLRHRTHPVEGVQFHPESIITDHGHRIIANWIGSL